MKRNAIAILAAACLMLTTGCQSKEITQPAPASSAAVQETDTATPLSMGELTDRVKAEKLHIPDGMWGLYNAAETEDGYLAAGSDSILHFSEDFTESTEIPLVPLASYDGYYVYSNWIAPGADVTYALVVMQNHDGMNPGEEHTDPSWWDRYYEVGWTSEYFLCTYASDGTMTDKVQIQGLDAYQIQQGAESYDNFCEFSQVQGQAMLGLFDGTLLRIGTDGSLTELCRPAEEASAQCFRFLTDQEGRILLYTEFMKSDPATHGYYYDRTLAVLDTDKKQLGEVIYSDSCNNVPTSPLSIGNEDYLMFLNSPNDDAAGSKLLGIRSDGTTDVIIDWKASDLPAMQVLPLKDGSFVAVHQEEVGNAMYHLTRLHEGEISEKLELNVGVFGYLYDDSVFQEFNQTNDKVHVDYFSYTNPDGTWSGDLNGQESDILEQFKISVLSGDAPDMVIISESHDLLLKLGSKGAFTDLKAFLSQDPEINRDTLVPNVLTALQHPNGALYGLANGFSVDTMLVKGKYDAPDNWTMDDMIALYDSAEKDVYQWGTKERALEMMLIGTDFTDELNGTCDFNSADFIRMLEFCNRFPANSSEPVKDYENPAAMEALNQYYLDQFHRYQNDEDLLYPMGFSAMGNSIACGLSYAKAELGGDVAFVGYPSADKQGGKIETGEEIAILSTCGHPAEAWEFVKAYIRTGSSKYSDFGGFSMLDSRFEEQLDDYMYIFGSIGNKGEFGRTDAECYEDDATVYPLTQAERDAVEQYIRGCSTYMMLDANVRAIIMEEAGMYFSGDRTAEETANVIQSRAELYLSEQS